MNNQREFNTKVDVLDFLIEILRHHERKLDELVMRLERATCKVLEDWK